MACFIAPVVEAVVVSGIKRSAVKKELQQKKEQEVPSEIEGKIKFSTKLGWLSNLLWGGSFLLAIEHIWHGEVVPWPPFFTAMMNHEDILPMVQEIATVGVTMAVFVTTVWAIMLLVVHNLEKKSVREEKIETEA